MLDPTNGSDRVAIVVPTRNSIRTLEACLTSLRQQSVACELIVVDNGSEDGSKEVALRIADIVLDGGPERSAQRNQGARATNHPVLGFIDSDMIVGPKVVEQALTAIELGAAGVVIPEETVGTGYWTRVRAFERSFYEGESSVEAARFFPRTLFEQSGGFDEVLTGPEDWDLSLRIGRLGPISRTEDRILHDEGNVTYISACGKKAYYAEGLERFFRKHKSISVGGRLLERPWVRHPQLLANPLGVGLLALKFGEATAVIVRLLRSRLGAARAPQPY